jgi:hypothetical protein
MAIGFPEFLTTLVLGGFVFIVVALAKINRDQNGITIKTIQNKEKFLLSFGAIIFIIAILLFVTSSGCVIKSGDEPAPIQTIPTTPTPTTTQTPTTIPVEIQITYPIDSATVKILETITGTAKNIPEGQQLWIAIFPHAAFKYYPQNPVGVQSDGSWTLPVQFGGENNVGEKFDIVAVLADKNAKDELNTYLDTCIKSNSWPGMRALPDGAKEYARVTVIREPAEMPTAEPSTLASPTIKMTYPSNASLVNIQETVKGTAENIPEGQKLWILVYPLTANKFYPQSGNVNVINGGWSLTIGLGTKENIGEIFKIITVLADKKAQDEFNAYLNTCKAVNEWPGMDAIPNSAKVYDEVTVTRV